MRIWGETAKGRTKECQASNLAFHFVTSVWGQGMGQGQGLGGQQKPTGTGLYCWELPGGLRGRERKDSPSTAPQKQ